MAKLKHLTNIFKPEFECFVFDKDGTIIDAHFYWVQMIKMRAAEISRIYFKESSHAFLQLIQIMGVSDQGNRLRQEGPVGIKPRTFIVETVRNECQKLGQLTSDEEIEMIFKKIDEKSAEDLSGLLCLTPGAQVFLETAKEHHLKLALATTDLTKRAELALKALNILQHFSLVVGADQVKKSKPDGEMGLLIGHELQISPEKMAMFGDHDVDIQMAKASGYAFSVGLKTGLNGDVFTSQPDVISKNFEELGVCI